MHAQQLDHKSSIPLAHDESTPRERNLSETCDATALQVVTESDRLERPIPRRDSIETHNAIAMSGTIGVRRTRSASAVR